MAGQGVVEVGDVGVVMTTMVNLHGLSVNVGLEGCLVVGECGKSVCHGSWSEEDELAALRMTIKQGARKITSLPSL
jgi:hypothetical protein